MLSREEEHNALDCFRLYNERMREHTQGFADLFASFCAPAQFELNIDERVAASSIVDMDNIGLIYEREV